MAWSGLAYDSKMRDMTMTAFGPTPDAHALTRGSSHSRQFAFFGRSTSRVEERFD